MTRYAVLSPVALALCLVAPRLLAQPAEPPVEPAAAEASETPAASDAAAAGGADPSAVPAPAGEAAAAGAEEAASGASEAPGASGEAALPSREPVSFAERAAAAARRTSLGGYGEFAFVAEQDQNSQFEARRFVLFLHSPLSERISLNAELEWERGGSPEKRDGQLEAGEVLVEYAALDLEIFEWLKLRGGVILVPFGTYNIRHDAPSQTFTDRPMAVQTITPTTWFDTGAGVLGDIRPTPTQRIHYELYFMNGLDSRLSGEFGTRAARPSLGEDNNNDKGLAAQVRYSPWLGADLGFSMYTGDYDLSDNRIWMFGGDGILRFADVELLFEYTRVIADEGFVEGFVEGSAANTRTAVPTGMSGFFFEARYKFIIPPLWDEFPEELADASITAALRYGETDPDDAVLDQFDRSDLTFGLTFRPISAVAFKHEVHLLRNAADGESVHLLGRFFEEAPTWRYASSLAFNF